MRSALLLPLLLVMTASASLVEHTGGVSYQFDAGTHHDAPDACQDVGPQWRIPANGTTDGMLVPGDDESDHYILNFTQADLGGRFTLRLEEVSTAAGDLRATFDILSPLCLSSVLAPENQPPVAPEAGPGQQAANPTNLNSPGECASRWFFTLTGVDAQSAPASINAIWTDGYQEDIPMRPSPPYPVGQYTTTSRLDVTLHSVTAILPASWSGNFRLGEGPCNTQDGGYIFGEHAVRMGDSISFSVISSGTYVVAVHLGDFEPRDPTQPVPLNCHYCLGVLEGPLGGISYLLVGERDDEAT